MKFHLDALHHFHLRKRIHHIGEKYPHPKSFQRLMDKCVYFVGVLGPIMTVPQLYSIWSTQDASGISLLTWGTYAFIALFWFTYATLHNEKPLIFTNLCWIIIHCFMLTGILLYR